MINTIFFGLNVLLVMIIWKYVLKPSILDYFRDKLFDLRDKVRMHYIKHNIALDDKTYIHLRDMINGHLRFTETMSLSKIAYFSNKIDKNEELKLYLKKQINKELKTTNEELSKFIEFVRLDYGRILQNYMILSSPMLLILFITIVIVYIPLLFAKKFLKIIKKELNYLGESLRKTSSFVTKYITTGDDLEELSFKNAKIDQFAHLS